MKSRKLIVALLAGIVLIAFLFGMNRYQQRVKNSQDEKVTQHPDRLVRMHSPVLGPRNAPVTLVEFFDPACESCRAFYPFVKDLLQKYPNDLRLVIRYAPFHQGSDKVVKLLEAAKRQDKYWPVLEAVLAAQPMWADHGNPKVDLAYKAAEQVGLDIPKALADASTSAVEAALQQDVQDLTALEVKQTPTFFVNGRSLSSFGPDPLADLVAQEVAKARR